MVLNKVNAFLMYQRRMRILNVILTGLFVLLELVAVKATATPVVWEWLGAANIVIGGTGVIVTNIAHRVSRNNYKWAVLGETLASLLINGGLLIAALYGDLVYYGFAVLAVHVVGQFFSIGSELAQQINHHIGSLGTAEENRKVHEEIQSNRKISQIGNTIAGMVGSAIAYVLFTLLAIDMFLVVSVVFLLCIIIEIYYIYIWYKYLMHDWDYTDVEK